MAVLYTQALADRAQAWVEQPLTEKRSAAGLLELATIWAAINQQPLPECLRQCQYSERAQALRAYLLEFSRFQNPVLMSDSTYQLAPQFTGVTLVDEGLSGAYTADNLTDEVAEFFIKKGRKDLFVKRGAQTDAEADTAGSTPADTRDFAGELEHEQKAHAVAISKLEKETEAHSKAGEALKSEKEAHKATKKELTEASKQLTEANKQIADLSTKLTEATATAAADSTADAAK